MSSIDETSAIRSTAVSEEPLAALPGTGDVMASVGRCHAMCWHAARSDEWDLAAYFLRRVRGLLRRLAIARPRYADQIRMYDVECLEPLHHALLARDRTGFEAVFDQSVTAANALHADTGHPYIRWAAPTCPPDDSLLSWSSAGD